MYKLSSPSDILSELCKLRNQYGMYLSWYMDGDNVEELCKACPILDVDTFINDDSAYLFFDTEAGMCTAFSLVIGDDGPTRANPYSGPGNVYATTCSNDGMLLTENT